MSEKATLIDWLEGLGLARHLNNADILAGITVNHVLAKIIDNYHVRVGETNTAATRIENWNIVVKELEKVGIHVGQQQKSKILNGDDKVVYNILYELKELYSKHKKEVGVNINQIDLKTDPKNATSMLQLLILLLVKYFGLSVKESVALLSNDSKYLAHILAKGFKESSVQVEGVLSQLIKLLPQVVHFCKNKQNLTFFVKSFKPGLISKYLSICEMTVQLLTQFLKTTESKYELIKQQLMSTYTLSIRRHPCQITAIANSIIQVLGFNKNILDLLLANAQLKQTAQFVIELISRAQLSNQESEVVSMFGFEQFINKIVEGMRNSDLFVSCGHLIIKLLEINYPPFFENREMLVKVLQNLSGLTLSKKSDIFIHTEFIFSLLTTLGKKKNALAPQYFKLAVQKYKNTLNLDQSENYLHNFISVCHIFPSIPRIGIVEAILFRSDTGSCNIAELQLQIIEDTITQMQETTVLRTYNTVTKLFLEEVGKVEYISAIIQNIVKHFESKIVMDLSIKFMKVCLAVFYANLRKLNYSKSLVEGTIKLNPTNAFYKAKNKEIIQLLKKVVSVNDEVLNKAIEPLVCYSFFQAQMKNKDEAQELKQVMKMFGTEEELRNMYEQEAKHLLDQVKKEQKKGGQKNSEFKRLQAKTRVNSDVLLLSKKKDHIYYNNQPISTDAKQGLERYSKAFKSRLAKLQLQQQQKRVQEIKMQFLKKKATLKVLEKGMKLAKQLTVNCIYEFDIKQRQLDRQEFSSLDHLPFYDPVLEEQRDVKGIQILLKKYAYVFKVYYHNYGGKLRPNTIPLFEDISHTAYLMQSANAWKLLRDHYLDQFISVKEVHFTIQRINAHLKKEYKDSSLLDYEVFENFLVQAAIIMFSRPPKDLRSRPLPQMLNEIIKKLKEKAGQNKIDQKLFQEERDDFKVESQKMEELKELNQQLAQNTDYILPEGYKKIVKRNIVFDYLIKIQANDQIKNRYADVLEIIDEIMFEKLGFHIIQAYSQLKVEATARPLLYKHNYQRTIKERSLSSILPKNKDINSKTEHQQPSQNDGLQKSEEQLERTKLQNKIIKQKKQKQLQLKKLKEQEDKKRQIRDKQIKALLEKYKERQSELEKQKEQQQEQKKRQEQMQRDNKKKYEEQLKKKVEEYSKIKEQQKQKQQATIKEKKEQENRKFQKLKEDVEKKKKMVEESKLKKKQEQGQKQQAEKIEKQRKEQQQRKKIEAQKETKKRMIYEFRQRKQKEQQQKSKQKAKANEPQQRVVKSKLKEKKQEKKQDEKKPKSKVQQITIQQVDKL